MTEPPRGPVINSYTVRLYNNKNEPSYTEDEFKNNTKQKSQVEE